RDFSAELAAGDPDGTRSGTQSLSRHFARRLAAAGREGGEGRAGGQAGPRGPRTAQEQGLIGTHCKALPADVTGEDQDRGNRSVLLMSRYEIQVLDSFATVTYARAAPVRSRQTGSARIRGGLLQWCAGPLSEGKFQVQIGSHRLARINNIVR